LCSRHPPEEHKCLFLATFTFGSGTTHSFSSGTLTVANGGNHENLSFAGSYTTGSFALSNDGAGGTLVKLA
jgi:hypothetical protein